VKAPKSVQCDRDIVLCHLNTNNWPFLTNARSRSSFLLDEPFPLRFPNHLWKDKAIVVAGVKLFPEVLLKELVPVSFLGDQDVFGSHRHFGHFSHVHVCCSFG